MPEWRECGIELWIDKARQPDPIGGRENDMPLWLGDASHLLDGQLCLGKPGQDADRNHEIEGAIFERQGIDITDIYLEQVSDPVHRRILMRLLDHSYTGID